MTSAITVTNGVWSSLGAGPMLIEVTAGTAIVVGSATQPVSVVNGHTLSQNGLGIDPRISWLGSDNLWAWAVTPSATVVVSAAVGAPIDRQLVPKGYYQVSVSTAASLATLIGVPVPSGSRVVYIQPETGDLRFRDDGVAPTTAIGSRILAGDRMSFNGSLSALSLISQSGGAITVNLDFYG